MRGSVGASKTLFVGLSARYQLLSLVHTGVLPGLLKAGHRLVVLAPRDDIARSFERALGSEVDSHAVPSLAPGARETALARAIIDQRSRSFPRFRSERWEAARAKLRARSPLHRLYDEANSRVGGRLDRERLLRAYWRRSHPEVDALFERYRPDLVLLSWAGAYPPCPTIYRSALRAGCPTMSLDASWDSMDERLLIPRLDRLLVWNEHMRREAVEWHDYDPKAVAVVGTLRCDYYRSTAGFAGREQTLRDAGLDPDRAVVSVATNRGSPALYNDTVAALLDADDAGRLARPIQVVLRVAPGVDWPMESLPRDDRLRVFKPFSSGVEPAGLLESAALVTHTDVMVSVLSTLILESCFSDTANVSMRYPELEGLYRRDFITPALESGGFSLATSPTCTVSEVASYLDEPQRHAPGRARLVEEFAGGRPLVAPRVRAAVDDMLRAGNR